MSGAMDLRELSVFVRVADTKSFSQAAVQLHLTQPTVSAHIASLEKKLGLRLLTRSTKCVALTDAGALLYGYAKELLGIRDDALSALGLFIQNMHGYVSLCATPGPAQHILPALLDSFRTNYPDITLQLRVADAAELTRQLLRGDADIGLCDSLPANEALLRAGVPGAAVPALHLLRHKGAPLSTAALSFWDFVREAEN